MPNYRTATLRPIHRPIMAVAIVALIGVLPGVAFASRGSILPSSFASVSLGSGYPIDVQFVGDQPCALLGTAGARDSLELRCGRRMTTRTTLDVTPDDEYAGKFDVAAGHLDVIGFVGRRNSNTMRPLLLRRTREGRAFEGFGAGGVANLDAIRPAGIANVMFTSVDTRDDGTVVVGGDALASGSNTAERLAFTARFTSAGALDTTYGEAGIRIIRVPGFRRASPTDLRVLDDGRIFVVGWASQTRDGRSVPFAALLDGTGSFDATFSGDGIMQPNLGSGTSAFYSLPRSGPATLPMHVGGSSNHAGSVRPWVVRVQPNGSLRTGWGGPTSHRTTTLTGGGPRMLQVMDIDMLDEVSVVGAGEIEIDGDTDSFVARFGPAKGAPDMTWGTSGFEKIDTRPGRVDGEWSNAVAMSPDGHAWVLGGSRLGNSTFAHLYRVRETGSPASAKTPGSSLFAFDSMDEPMDCGSTARRACMVRRGQPLDVAASVAGWDATRSPLLKPVLHVWTKGARGWKMREQLGREYRSSGFSVTLATLRLGVGVHEIVMHRNGGPTWGAAWGETLHVRVT